jgi:dTDP-4-amino-4,6-dideoxygalactose transaminase
MIPFNRPYLTGNEIPFLKEAYKRGQFAGNGVFTQKCQAWIERNMDVKKALLTHSCTAALEMAAILADIQPGDEIIMTSYTFVSTANAFVLRGGVPIFVDIRPDTLNIDEKLIEAVITTRTKAIVLVHYAGVGCEMDSILKIARKHRLCVIEDAAHAVRAKYRGRELGSMGDLGALSFHETKNVTSGEGGALLVNQKEFLNRADIIWQKGTNRKAFEKGLVAKYTWVDIGSSFLPGEIIAAFLWGQLEKIKTIQRKRKQIWKRYHRELKKWAEQQGVVQPFVPEYCEQSYHMYYLLMPSIKARVRFIRYLKEREICAVFHYLPLHLSPYAHRWGGEAGDCPVTESVSDRLVRLPFYTGLTQKDQDRVIQSIQEFEN